LNPVRAKRGFRRSGVAQDIVEPHIGAIHDIDTPQWRLFDEEILYRDVAYIPPYEGHRPPRLRIPSLCCVPNIAVPIDATSTEAVNVDVVTSEDDTCVVVLESNGIGVVAPVR
jgi:hypothetical protein